MLNPFLECITLGLRLFKGRLNFGQILAGTRRRAMLEPLLKPRVPNAEGEYDDYSYKEDSSRWVKHNWVRSRNKTMQIGTCNQMHGFVLIRVICTCSGFRMPISTRFNTVRALANLMRTRRTVVLSGAGVSTESGIPDYRGPDSPRRERAPISYQEFVGDAEARRRYWARSSVGWPRFTAARPNAGHKALSRLEAAGYVAGVITQNVDGLHQAAGSEEVVELHGALADVRCLRCGRRTNRATYQRRLLQANPGWPPEPATLAPDGDAVLPDEATTSFRVPSCQRCGGTLKPDVVFFGESVPRVRVDAAWECFDQAEMLLVVGSSLAVYSGFRFVRRAAEEARPVGIVNLGPTRGDVHARLRLQGRTGVLLPRLAEMMGV